MISVHFCEAGQVIFAFPQDWALLFLYDANERRQKIHAAMV
jgi:hypothetical protein